MTTDRPWWTTLEERDALLGGAAAAGGLGGAAPSDDGRDGDDVPAPGAGPAWALSRRTFLAASGFSFAALLASCGRAPRSSVSSGARQPEEVVPGRAVWYATGCQGCAAGCGLVVKCRDGRPIKVEGNPEHPVSKGGVCAAGQAGVLGLYDSRRLRDPVVSGAASSWAAADAAVRRALEDARAKGEGIRLLTTTLTGPSTRAEVARFLAAFPTARHVVYDPLSCSALLDAVAATRGARVLPRARLDRAETILGLDCDFLGTWVSPVEHTKGYRAARALDRPSPAQHWQVEPALTLTGSNADRRLRVEASAVGAFAAHLAAALAPRAGLSAPAAEGAPPVDRAAFDALVDRLWATRGRSVVLCGTNDRAVQLCVALANEALGAHAAVLDLDAPSHQRAGDDAALAALAADAEAGRVGVLVVAGANPVADAPDGGRVAAALARVGATVSLSTHEDETSARCRVSLPLPHAFEAWDDAEPVAGVVGLSQPLVAPFREARTLRACLAAWRGAPAKDLDLVREAWRTDVFPRAATPAASFDSFWSAAVHDGFATVVTPARAAGTSFLPEAAAAARPATAAPGEGRLSLALVPSVSMLDGRHAHNAWLHELPDPITKQVWGNAALLSPAAARRLGVDDGDVVRLDDGRGATVEVPALVQAGLPDATVALALGFGRRGTDRFAGVGPAWIEGRPTVARGGTVGVNAAVFLRARDGAGATAGIPVSVVRTGRRDPVARSQTYGSLSVPAATAPKGGERRDAVRETTLAAWRRDPATGAAAAHGAGHGPTPDLWAGAHAEPERRWAMAIDLSACTGCSACVVSCQAENNVPVVGRDEVRRRRDLSWLRIDRYYADVPGAPGEVDVVHQPMLCHHCANAPCETVCPVLATSHDAEGLNGQAYNRCVGTRYCANNCPYKVRRFNWFDYERPDRLADLVLNPDVTVRSRGVMEKCSFCVQRLQEARAEAKRAGRQLLDGDAETACQQSCPADAIVFGDVNDPASRIAKVAKDPRRYRLLEELNVKPSVLYLTKVRHRERPSAEGRRHG
jgi:molybdopterin-containing oxidoreductase family iron-sulfur binding subunit